MQFEVFLTNLYRRSVGEEVIFEYRKVRHGCVDQGRERIIAIFCNHEIPSPGRLFSEVSALYIANAFVDGELHPVPRYGGIKDNVRVRKFFVHAVQGFDELSQFMSVTVASFGRWQIHDISML